MNYFKTIYKTHVLCALMKLHTETSLLRTKTICLIGENMIIHCNHWGGGVLFLCLPPFNSNFRYFEIKYLLPGTSNLRDSVVICLWLFYRAVTLLANV